MQSFCRFCQCFCLLCSLLVWFCTLWESKVSIKPLIFDSDEHQISSSSISVYKKLFVLSEDLQNLYFFCVWGGLLAKILLRDFVNKWNPQLYNFHFFIYEVQCCYIFRIHPQIARISGLPFFLGVAIYCYEVSIIVMVI